MKSFFKMVKYEYIRVFRNKFVSIMLVLFPIILLSFLSSVDVELKKYEFAVFTDGIESEQLEVYDQLLHDTANNKIIYVKSVEEGKKLVNKGKVAFFICLDSSEDPVTATFYYDGTSVFGKTIRESMQDKSNQYSYDKITSYLEDFGIKIDESYFNLVTFKTATKQNVTVRQMPFSMEVGIGVAIVLTFGLAYSLSRDNETNVSRNISYMPVGANRYLLSKVFVYFTLGIIEMLSTLLIGMIGFKIHFQVNIGIVVLLSSFFVLAVIMLGLLFGLLKSQIATVLCNTLCIIAPLFALIMVHINTLNIWVQMILYCCPMTAFVTFLNGLMYNRIFDWVSIAIFTTQIIGYYLITLFILKRRIKR